MSWALFSLGWEVRFHKFSMCIVHFFKKRTAVLSLILTIWLCNMKFIPNPGEGRLDRAGLQEAFLSVGVESVDQMVKISYIPSLSSSLSWSSSFIILIFRFWTRSSSSWTRRTTDMSRHSTSWPSSGDESDDQLHRTRWWWRRWWSW